MDLSPIGEAVLIAREGRRLTAYRDSVGVLTIGIGHTSAAGPPRVTPGLTITSAECDAIFRRDVRQYVAAVRVGLSGPLAPHAFDALVSLCFNIGPAAFRRSTVLRRLRAGDRAGAAEAILMWNRPAVLIPRRQAEYDQFRTPYDTARPRARRGDPYPVAPPAAAPSSHPPEPPLPPGPVPVASPPSPGLGARLRAWLGGFR